MTRGQESQRGDIEGRPSLLERATIIVYALGKPYTIRREGSQFYVQDSPARILSVEPEQNTVRLAYETEDIDRTLLSNMPITGEQFYQLLYGEQPPDLGRFGRLEAQLELLTQSHAPGIVPAITEAALAKMLHELPVSVTISRGDNRYIWQFLQGSGSAETFIDAMREALIYLEAANLRNE